MDENLSSNDETRVRLPGTKGGVRNREYFMEMDIVKAAHPSYRQKL